MSGQFVPDQETSTTPAQIFDAFGSAWGVLWGKPRRASLLVVLAQSAFETGRWRRGFHCFNLGNIKHLGDNDPHDFTFFACDEDIDGEVRHFVPPDPGCCFRAYPSLAAAAADQLSFLQARYATAWSAVEVGNPYLFAQLLKKGGYYTGPVEQYADSLRSLFNEYDLTIGLPFDLHTTAGLQAALNDRGANPKLVVDGSSGPKTRAAVAAYQRAHGLIPSGIADSTTLQRIASEYLSSDGT